MMPSEFHETNEWDKIRQTIYYYVNHIQSITTFREGVLLLYDIICFTVSTIVKYCCSRNSSSDHSGLSSFPIADRNDNNYTHDELDDRCRTAQRRSGVVFNHIATTYTAFYIYTVIALSMTTHQLWMLHGISIYISGMILSYVIKWIMYILDDRELVTNYQYLRSWLYLLIHEGEDIINGDAAWKLASAYMMVQQAPTGISYLRYALRYKTRILRKQFLMELGGNRFGTGFSITALKSKLAASLLRTSSSDNITTNKNQMFNDDGDGYYEEIWHNDKNDVELVLQQKKRKWR